MNLTREIITHASEADWLAARKLDVTSTEAAALFNAGVYVKTFYELFNLKAGVIQPEAFEGNERTRWGNRLEAPIAYGIAEDLGLVVEPFKVYARIPEARVGSSFDFKIVGLAEGFEGDETYRDLFRQHGPGILEVKNVDGLQFKRSWAGDGEAIEAPVHIEAQVQHQMLVADLGWSVIAPLVGGNTPRPLYRLRDQAVGDAILAKARELWQRINAMAPPEPDFTKDGATIAQVYRDNDGSSIDLSDNPRVLALAKAYKKAGAEEKAAKEAKDAAKAELLTIIEHAKSVAAGPFKISAGTNNPTVRKAYFRDGYQRVTITLTDVPASEVEASEVPAFRNFRLSGGEAA